MRKSDALCALVLIGLAAMGACQPPFETTPGSAVTFNNVVGGNSVSEAATAQLEAQQFVDLLKSPSRSCSGQKDGKCKINPPKFGKKGSAALAKALRDAWASLKQTTHDEFVAADKNFQKTLLQGQGLPQSEINNILGVGPATSAIIPGNLRKLFSANNQHPFIDEANILAYEGNYLYVMRWNQLRVVQVAGTSLTNIYTETFPSGTYGTNLVVHNGFIGLVLQRYSSQSYTQVRIYRNNAGSFSFIRQFEIEGYYRAGREYNGKFSVIVEDYQITDLSWDVLGPSPAGVQYPFISACASWDGLGTNVRNFATIDLALGASYTLMTYIGCDPGWDDSYMSPTGKWYVRSLYYSGYYNTILQQVDSATLQPALWSGLSNVYIPSQHGMDEANGCNLRVAAASIVSGVYKLQLLSLNCFDLTVDYSTFIGPSWPIAVRWVSNFVYASFYGSTNGEVWKISQGPSSFSTVSSVSHTQIVYSFYEYGPSNVIGFGSNYTSSNTKISVMLYLTSGSGLSLVMNYNIDPATNYLWSYIYESSHQYLHVDYPNKKVILPISSNGPEPFSGNGFYYLHVDPSTPCMIYPPINFCPTTGSASTQNRPLNPRVYKHWDNYPGYIWTTGPSEMVYRSTTIKQGTLSYLYTVSQCQIQAREHPSLPLNPNLPLTPLTAPSILDLC